MHALQISSQTAEQLEVLRRLYRHTRDVRIRTRTQIALVGVEQAMSAPRIAVIVRENDGTVRTWLRRCEAEGTEGLSDRPRPGGPSKITPAFVEKLLEVVRKRPRGLDVPFLLWSCQRLADYMAEQLGIRVLDETIRRQLSEHGVALSRPQHKVSSPDLEYDVKKMLEDTRNHLKWGEVFYYADEFNVSWLPTLRAMWSPVSQ